MLSQNLVAHKIYGVPQTINTANYVYFQAFAELSALNGTEESTKDGLYKIVVGWRPIILCCRDFRANHDGRFADELLNLHRGQGLDLFWRDALFCPSEEEYIAMVNNSMFPVANPDVTLLIDPQRPGAYFAWQCGS